MAIPHIFSMKRSDRNDLKRLIHAEIGSSNGSWLIKADFKRSIKELIRYSDSERDKIDVLLNYIRILPSKKAFREAKAEYKEGRNIPQKFLPDWALQKNLPSERITSVFSIADWWASWLYLNKYVEFVRIWKTLLNLRNFIYSAKPQKGITPGGVLFENIIKTIDLDIQSQLEFFKINPRKDDFEFILKNIVNIRKSIGSLRNGLSQWNALSSDSDSLIRSIRDLGSLTEPGYRQFTKLRYLLKNPYEPGYDFGELRNCYFGLSGELTGEQPKSTSETEIAPPHVDRDILFPGGSAFWEGLKEKPLPYNHNMLLEELLKRSDMLVGIKYDKYKTAFKLQ